MFTSLDDIYNKLVKEHGSVYALSIEDDVFMYKPLTKKEYELFTSRITDEFELQDAIIRATVLYPERIDLDEMYPGDVLKLAQAIIDQSCVMFEDRVAMLEMYSQEMLEIDNVMCCLIMRAFPAYKLEDIENMPYPDFYRLYTRAEWFLVNVKQDPLQFSALESYKSALGMTEPQGAHSDYYANEHDQDNAAPQEQQQSTEETGKYMGRKLSEVMDEINSSGSKRKPMSEEQKRELEKFKQQFPDIAMDQDAMYTGLLSEKAGNFASIPRHKY